jgi:hypothetical protein
MPRKVAAIVLPIALCIAVTAGISYSFWAKAKQLDDIAMSSCFYASTMVSYLNEGRADKAKHVGEAGIRESALALVENRIKSPGSLNFLRNLLSYKRDIFKEEEYKRIQQFVHEYTH